MKIATLISATITALLLLSTMTCGLWLRANNITDPGSISFHVNCGMASVVFFLVTFVMVIIMLARMKKRG